MSKYCEKCSELIKDEVGRTSEDGLIICELCWQDEQALAEEPEEPEVFDDGELEDLDENLEDIIDDDELDDDFEPEFEDDDEDDDEDYGYTSYRNNYNDEENDLYEGLVDQERSFF